MNRRPTLNSSSNYCRFIVQNIALISITRSLSAVGACNLADQMAEWYRASAFGSVDMGFDSESGQTNDLQIGIHGFPA